MKDKMIITLSDINGTKQYTLSQFIKHIFYWVIVIVVLAFIIGAMIMKYLSTHVDNLEKEKVSLKKEIELKSETLKSMDEQLQEVKKLIGADDVENKDISEVVFSTPKESSEQTVDMKENTSTNILEYKILSSLIPNGKPLNYKRISTKFGFRIHPITHRKQFHSADDLAAKSGTPIYAPADGVVVYAGKKRFYGNFLLLQHGLGFSTAYGHLLKFKVKTGQYIKKGQLVGLCGSTGRSTGPHVHYEIRYLSKWLDPEPFMKHWNKYEYKKVLKNSKYVDFRGIIKSIESKIQLVKNNLENKGE